MLLTHKKHYFFAVLKGSRHYPTRHPRRRTDASAPILSEDLGQVILIAERISGGDLSMGTAAQAPDGDYASRYLRSPLRLGLVPAGVGALESVGAEVPFDCDRHQPISLPTSLSLAVPVCTRIPGLLLTVRVLKAAAVEPSNGPADQAGGER